MYQNLYPVRYSIIPGPNDCYDLVENKYTPEGTFLLSQSVVKRYKTYKAATKALARYNRIVL